jgi:hypothetical protein
MHLHLQNVTKQKNRISVTGFHNTVTFSRPYPFHNVGVGSICNCSNSKMSVKQILITNNKLGRSMVPSSMHQLQRIII